MRWPLFFILLSPLTWGKTTNEMLSDKELSKKFVSVIKENEIEKLITRTKDFEDCRKKNEFNAKDSQEVKERKAKDAQKCFQDKIANKETKDIQKLSDQLGLESYQLVQSKNVKDITNYLGERMYKALTGISEKDKRNEIQLANLKFKDRQIVDQVEFFKLYSYQLTKNALLEISRFCFENFQNTTPLPEGEHRSTSTFADHWKEYFEGKKPLSVSDQGQHNWGKLSSEDADPSAAYNQIFASIGNANPQKLGEFWEFCSTEMKRMCDEYEPGKTSGANSCLAINRLRNMRNAIASSQEIEKQMYDDSKGSRSVDLDGGAKAKFFRAEKDNSYDNLTNVTSYDLLTGKKDKNLETLADECQKSPEKLECDDFIAQGGASTDELIHKIDQEMRLKQEAEIKKILLISKQDLKEYLEKNGYFDLAQKEDLSDTDIRDFLNKEFDAKRVAVTNQLKNKVGSRQVADDAKKEDKAEKVKASAKETQEERARLAQVILFNNIVTSNLSLLDKDNNPLGKNTGAWKKESEALAKTNIESDLFKNIQSAIDTSTSSSNNKSISGTAFIDSIIGKKVTDTKSTKTK